MFILAINSATKNTEIALFKNKSIIFERSWLSNRDEAAKLLPAIETALKKNKLNFADLEQLICITGPGAYTGLRIGITTANAISYSIKKPIIPITTWQYLAAKVPTKLRSNTIILLKGAGNFHTVAALSPNLKPRILSIEQLKKITLTKRIIHDLNSYDLHELAAAIPGFKKAILTKKQLAPLGKAINVIRTKMPAKSPKTAKNIEPVYLQQPNITVSKKNTFKNL